MRADLRAALAGAGLRARRGPHRALPAVEHRLDHRTRPPQARRARDRATRRTSGRGPGPIPLTLDRAGDRRPLPALRLARHRGALPLRPDGLHGAAPVPGLPGAVRAHEGAVAVIGGDRGARPRPLRLPHPAGRRRRAALRRRRRRHVRRSRRTCRRPSRSGPASTSRCACTPTRGRSGARTRSAPRPVPCPGSGSAASTRACSPSGWSTGCSPATRSRSRRRRGRSPRT